MLSTKSSCLQSCSSRLCCFKLEFLLGQHKSRGNVFVTPSGSKGSSLLSSALHFHVFALFTAPSALGSSWFSSRLELLWWLWWVCLWMYCEQLLVHRFYWEWSPSESSSQWWITGRAQSQTSRNTRSSQAGFLRFLLSCLVFFSLNVIAYPLNILGKVQEKRRERALVKNGTCGNFWIIFACWA